MRNKEKERYFFINYFYIFVTLYFLLVLIPFFIKNSFVECKIPNKNNY